MPVNPSDSAVFGTLYGSDPMRAILDERVLFQRMLDVEAALARVQARLGIIPEDAALAITAAAFATSGRPATAGTASGTASTGSAWANTAAASATSATTRTGAP